MSGALWKTSLVDEARAFALSAKHQIPERVARWFCSRGVSDEEIPLWLHPAAKWSDPFQFTDMSTAIERIQKAISNEELICVIGDYDVDGVTASTILLSTLDILGARTMCIIPHRVMDGYGLSINLVERAKEQGADLLITVDNGIRAQSAIVKAADCGMEVIVTDHHEPDAEPIADAVAVVHWSRATNSGCEVLSGAGVAWKLASALMDACGREVEELRGWHLGLAALGALADAMPMRGENRDLVREGVIALKRCQKPGWLAICQTSRLDVENLSPSKLLWSISPRLNAAGRMASAETALALLQARSADEAERLAAEIETLNQARRRETDLAIEEALAQCREQYPDGSPAAVVAAGPWKLGIVGIVAAKLASEFLCPAIVLSDDGTAELRGSGRAPKAMSLYDAAVACEADLVRFGGHAGAIGCTVRRENVAAFRAHFMEAVRMSQVEPTVEEEPECLADDYLPLADATLDTLKWVNKFGPFGSFNPELTFYVGPVRIVASTPMGNGKHLRIQVREVDIVTDLIWFNAPRDAFLWPVNSQIFAIVTLEENNWHGTRRAQLHVAQAALLERPLVREDFAVVYRLLRLNRKLRGADLERALPARSAKETQIIADAFVELGFADHTESGYHVLEQVIPRDLRESHVYQAHLLSVQHGDKNGVTHAIGS